MNNELMKKTNQLQKGILDAMRKGNFAKVANLQAQLMRYNGSGHHSSKRPLSR